MIAVGNPSRPQCAETPLQDTARDGASMQHGVAPAMGAGSGWALWRRRHQITDGLTHPCLFHSKIEQFQMQGVWHGRGTGGDASCCHAAPGAAEAHNGYIRHNTDTAGLPFGESGRIGFLCTVQGSCPLLALIG